MKIAITTWSGRVSPVLDVARQFLVVESLNGEEVSRYEVGIEEAPVATRAKRIAELGVDVLICGAVSQPLEAMLGSSGISLIPHTCGPVEDILQAFLSGQLTPQSFLMPGCCGRRRHGAGRVGGGQGSGGRGRGYGCGKSNT